MTRLPLVSPLDRALFLKAHPFLHELPPASVAALAAYSEERTYDAGDVIHEAGVLPRELCFLATGSVEVTYAGAEPFVIEAPGGIGLIDAFAGSDAPRVVAREPTLGLAIALAVFEQLLEDDFVMVMGFAADASHALLDALAGRGAPPSCMGRNPDLPRDRTSAMLDLVDRLAFAREVPFFERTNLTVLTELLRFQEPRVIAAGEVLWNEGDPVESLALLLDGEFESLAGGLTTRYPVGSMLGAWTILSGRSRSETLRATEPSRILEIDRSLFVDVLEDHFEFAIDYLGKVCRRLVEARTGRPIENASA